MKAGRGFYEWDPEKIKAERQRYDELLRAGLKLIRKELPEIK
jgi:3-hydroxybutyryl-CoA dehydrogenase